MYKTIIKPIWMHGIPLWRTAATSHMNKLELLRSKIIRTVVNAPWYVRNENLRKDLKITMVKEEIDRCTNRYKEGITTHPNQLVEAYKTRVKGRLRRKAYPIQCVTVYALHIAI